MRFQPSRLRDRPDARNEVASLNRLIRQQPQLPSPQLLLAKVYLSQRSTDEALAVYRSMIKQYSTNAQVLVEVGGNLAMINQTNEAAGVFRGLCGLYPEDRWPALLVVPAPGNPPGWFCRVVGSLESVAVAVPVTVLLSVTAMPEMVCGFVPVTPSASL